MFFRRLAGRLELRFSDVMCIDAREPHSGSMDAQHDRERLGGRLVEDRFQYPDHEILRRVVVVVQQDPPEPGPGQLLVAPRFGDG